VGNWIADEVLYQARLDPRRGANSLNPAEAARLRARLRSVVALSVRVQSDSDRYPRTWLFHDRWGKRADGMTARRERIHYLTLGGRTTAWVPVVQK
jgi:formamidopyrimidine-DNA glycosylase